MVVGIYWKEGFGSVVGCAVESFHLVRAGVVVVKHEVKVFVV